MGHSPGQELTAEVWVELLGKLLKRGRAQLAHRLLPTWNPDEKSELAQVSRAMRKRREKDANTWAPRKRCQQLLSSRLPRIRERKVPHLFVTVGGRRNSDIGGWI